MATGRRKLESRYANYMKAKRQRRSSIISLVISGIIVAIVAAFFFFGKQNLEAKNQEYIRRKEQLELQLKEQRDIQAYLEERTKYVQTKKYIEEMAKNKLGLVYPDEIIFRPIVEK